MEVIKTVKQKVPANIAMVCDVRQSLFLRHRFGPINLMECSNLLVRKLAYTPQEADLRA